MVDLLATKLGGTTSLRPADPRTVFAAWGRRDAAPTSRGGRRAPDRRRGRGGSAGRGRNRRERPLLTVNAQDLDVADGDTSAQASAEGSVDSLPQLVDRLAANLLALGAGEDEQRLAALTSTSLPALRAYLDGEALLRRGDFNDADRSSLTRRRWIPRSPRRRRRGAGERMVRRRHGAARGAWATGIGCPAAIWRGWRPSWAPATRRRRAWATDQGRGAFRAARSGQPGRLVQARRLSLSLTARSRVSPTPIAVPRRRSTAPCRSTRPTPRRSSISARSPPGLDDSAGVRAGWPC